MTTPATTTTLPLARQQNRSEQAQAAAREIILTARFICHFDITGQIHLAELQAGTLCIHPADLPAAIAAGTLPRDLLLAIVAAATARLGMALPGGPDE
ncbi:hypothetical protein ACQCLI_13090 [Pseudomonas nitroreducens]|uniref:hypothetical protein n=1 Tax=Pseudomonas nitroreducens TaxID=46680 RepID=UPI00035DABD9|nr:hypothetical protein [Pseudomonas nitroreducens]